MDSKKYHLVVMSILHWKFLLKSTENYWKPCSICRL